MKFYTAVLNLENSRCIFGIVPSTLPGCNVLLPSHRPLNEKEDLRYSIISSMRRQEKSCLYDSEKQKIRLHLLHCAYYQPWLVILETKTILYLLKIPFQFLAPLILLLASIGAYIGRGLVLDVMVMFLAGIIGFLLRRSGYSIPGIVLGIILGKIGEQNFAQGMQMVHYDIVAYLSRPICSLLILAGVLTLGVGVYQALRAPAKKA